jgi:tetratricopeptide (TPR) repeat protein
MIGGSKTMNKTLLQTLEKVESLLDDREYKQALSVLGKVDPTQLQAEEEQSRYYYSYARCYRGVGEYKKALEGIECALVLSRKTDNQSLFANQKHLLGLIYMALGNIADAIEAFNEAYVFRKNAGEYDKIYGSLVNLAYAHFLKGNLPMALSVVDDAVKHAEQYNTPEEIRVCQTNRSRVMIFLGEFKEAKLTLEPYEKYTDITPSDKAFAVQSLGMLNVFMLNEGKAGNYLQKALDMYKRLNMQREQIVCLEYFGLNEYFAGNCIKAKGYYLDILGRGEEITPSARAQTLRMLTDVYIAQDIFDQAEKKAAEAEEAIRIVNENIELGALYRAYGQIYAHKNDSHQALEYFQKSIDLLQRCSARYELALTYLTCGCSKVYSVEERRKYLGQARELFEEMDVPNWVKQVDKELSFIQTAQDFRQIEKKSRSDVTSRPYSKDDYLRKLDRLNLKSIALDLKLRKKFSSRVFLLIVIWLSVVVVLVSLQGFGVLGFGLPVSVLVVLVSTTTVNILGFLYVVLKYVFRFERKK